MHVTIIYTYDQGWFYRQNQSLVYLIDQVGPKTQPWGTPDNYFSKQSFYNRSKKIRLTYTLQSLWTAEYFVLHFCVCEFGEDWCII